MEISFLTIVQLVVAVCIVAGSYVLGNNNGHDKGYEMGKKSLRDSYEDSVKRTNKISNELSGIKRALEKEGFKVVEPEEFTITKKDKKNE